MEPTPLRFDDRMSDEDALLWSLDTEASVPSTITVVILFDGRPDPRQVTWSVERLAHRIPRFRDRVVTSPVSTAPPRWEPYGDFCLADHLVRSVLDTEVSPETALRRAETLAITPFDTGRPLWLMEFLTGTGGGAALIVKLHHSFTDGMGLVKMAAELFDFEAGPAVRRADDAPGRSASSSPVPWLERIQDDLAGELRYGVDLIRSVLPWAAASVREAATDPRQRATAASEAVRALRALAEAASKPGSPILVARSKGARLGALSLPLEDLRQSAQRAGATVNDVFLAAVLGGLRRYHTKHGSQPLSLRIGVPVSTRRAATDAAMHNQVAPMLVRAPLQLVDAVERVRLVHELVASARSHPALGILESATGVLRRVPGSMQVLKRFLGCIDVLASNVPGSPVDLYLGGARVERIVPIGPRGGTALNLTLLSHVDSVHVGVNMDPIAVPDPAALVDCLYAGFDETLA